MLQTQNPYSQDRIDSLTAVLAGMDARQRQDYAAQHKNDPAVISVALNVSNILSAAERSKAMQAGMGAKPTVVDQRIASMAPPAPMTGLPEDQGIAQLPTPNIKHMADGGIAGFDESSNAPITTQRLDRMGNTDGMFNYTQDGGGVMRMAEGGMKKMSGSELFETALKLEGITDPAQIAFLKSIHGQESGGKASSKDSNRGAKGPMQVMPDTFKSVADPDMDITKPLDNMRAGIRYGLQGFNAAKGDPVLAGAYYYGGPGGMQKAVQGVAVSDPKNPKAPTTIGYGQSIAQRMASLLPIGTAQAGEKAPQGQPAIDVPRGPEGSSVFGGAAGLGSLLGAKLGALGGNLGELNKVLTPATRAGIAAPGVGMGAGIGAVGGALSAGAANALSNATPEQLSQLQGDIGSDTGLAAAIMNPENRKPQAYIPTNPTENQSAAETARLQRQNDILKNPPKEVQKEAIALAKEELPKETLLGFDKNDIMMFGLRLMAGQSPFALQNVGEAGIGTIAAKQAREKAAIDKSLAEAHKEYYSAAGAKARAEAQALADNTKGLSGLVQAYAKDPMALKMLEASDNPQDQKLAALIKMQIQQMVGQAPAPISSTPTGPVRP
jgi:hypothetical protein